MRPDDWFHMAHYNTDKCTDIKKIFGLYPHNSYLDLFYSSKVLRVLLLLFILIYLVESNNVSLAFTIFILQAGFIHEMLVNSALI